MEIPVKEDSLPTKIQEQINKLITEKFKYDPKEIMKILSTPTNKVTCLKLLRHGNHEGFFCEKPMDIDEAQKLIKCLLEGGSALRPIGTAVEI